MKKRQVSVVLFHTKEGKVMLQDRHSMSKFGEEWSFFGGKVEKDESPTEAVIREIYEELSYDLKDFRMFSTIKKINEIDKEMYEVTYYIYIKEIPEKPKLFTVNEGDGLRFFTVDEALKLKLGPFMDKEVLEMFKRSIDNGSVLDQY